MNYNDKDDHMAEMERQYTKPQSKEDIMYQTEANRGIGATLSVIKNSQIHRKDEMDEEPQDTIPDKDRFRDNPLYNPYTGTWNTTRF